MAQQNTLKMINGLTPNVNQTSRATSVESAGVSQPILANVANSVQLAVIAEVFSDGLTCATTDPNNGLLNALTGQTPSVAKQTPSQSSQTFVIPNPSTAVSSATSGVVVTNAVRPETNIILTRPHSFGHLINQHQLCRLVSSSIRYKHRTAPYWYRYRYSHTSLSVSKALSLTIMEFLWLKLVPTTKSTCRDSNLSSLKSPNDQEKDLLWEAGFAAAEDEPGQICSHHIC